LPIRNLPTRLNGAFLAQLSDLHIGRVVDDGYMVGVFDLVRELSPEIVVYTGDWISYDSETGKHAARIISRAALGTVGTYGILGNHDYGNDWSDSQCADLVTSFAENVGVKILRNEMADVNGLKIVGLDDLWAGRFEPAAVLPKLESNAASLVLSHNPDSVDRRGWEGYSGWILAGHTHGGQCKPPFLPPPLLPVRNRMYTSGEFALSGGRQMYISRGVGHLLRVRFNARPEVTLFRLVNAS
jgi:predicted MPP superfamily phosphohydrolase